MLRPPRRLVGHADCDFAAGDASILARHEEYTVVGGRIRGPLGASCFARGSQREDSTAEKIRLRFRDAISVTSRLDRCGSNQSCSTRAIEDDVVNGSPCLNVWEVDLEVQSV